MDGSRLRALRVKKKLTQLKLAKLSGVSVRTIQAIEAGSSNVTERTIIRLAKALGVEPGELMGA